MWRWCAAPAQGRQRSSQPTRYGVTPLSLAVVNGNTAIVEVLLASGADPNTVSGEGETVLMSAARRATPRSSSRCWPAGPDPNARERWRGQTALMWAAGENHPAVVTTLLRHGADPNLSGRHSRVLVDGAVRTGHAEDRDAARRHDRAPIRGATGLARSRRALSSAPGDRSRPADPDGINALLYATLNGHFDIAALPVRKRRRRQRSRIGFGRTVLFAAIADEPPRSRAAAAGAKRRRRDPASTGPAGARKRRRRRTRRSSAGCPNRCTQGCQPAAPEGATPLWRAARAGDLEGVRLLLDAGANARAAASDGSTPLMVAAGVSWRDDRGIATEEESIAVVRMLLGAAARASTNETRRAKRRLHGAAGRGAAEVIRFLVASGADLQARDKTRPHPASRGHGHIGSAVAAGRRRSYGHAGERRCGEGAARADGSERRADRALHVHLEPAGSKKYSTKKVTEVTMRITVSASLLCVLVAITRRRAELGVPRRPHMDGTARRHAPEARPPSSSLPAAPSRVARIWCWASTTS